MRYPIFVHQTSCKRFIALCPLVRDFYAEAGTVELALGKLKEKFLCYLHDENIELEIIPVSCRESLVRRIRSTGLATPPGYPSSGRVG